MWKFVAIEYFKDIILNSDGPQIHQYQQHQPQLTTYKRGPRHTTLDIQVLVFGQHINVAGLNPLMRFQQFHLDN